MGEEAPRPTADNLLIIVADDLGIDKVASYRPEGAHLPELPTLESLVAVGVRFETAYAMPTCSPTRGTLLTGRYPHQTGLGARADHGELSLAERTIADVLSEAGYATAAVGKWHLSSQDTESGYAHPNLQGFDHFAGTLGNLEPSYYDWPRVVNGTAETSHSYATTVTVDDALDWVETAPEPWFLYVSFNAAHIPLDEPPARLHHSGELPTNATPPHRFKAVAEAMDTELGRLLAGIDDKVMASTTTIFVGDNGSDADTVTPPQDPQRAKSTVFEGGVRVPLVVTGPRVHTPGSTSSAFASVADLWATALDIAEVSDPSPGVVDSHSLLPYLTTPGLEGARTHLFAERMSELGGPPYYRHLRTIRDDRYKLVIDDRGASYEELLYALDGGEWDEGEPITAEDRTLEEQRAFTALSDALADLDARSPYAPKR